MASGLLPTSSLLYRPLDEYRPAIPLGQISALNFEQAWMVDDAVCFHPEFRVYGSAEDFCRLLSTSWENVSPLVFSVVNYTDEEHLPSYQAEVASWQEATVKSILASRKRGRLLVRNAPSKKNPWNIIADIGPGKYLDVSNLKETGSGAKVRDLSNIPTWYASIPSLKVASSTESGILRFLRANPALTPEQIEQYFSEWKR